MPAVVYLDVNGNDEFNAGDAMYAEKRNDGWIICKKNHLHFFISKLQNRENDPTSQTCPVCCVLANEHNRLFVSVAR